VPHTGRKNLPSIHPLLNQLIDQLINHHFKGYWQGPHKVQGMTLTRVIIVKEIPHGLT